MRAPKTIIEPFRIKMVEPIKMTSPEEREKLLEEAGLNPFLIKSEDVLLDLLTDSGTGAMSTMQWSALMKGDESYAGSPSFFRFEKSVREITGHEEVIPTHQGRASERIIFSTLVKPGQIVISNTLFDTTRANAECSGCTAIDIPCVESRDTQEDYEFKGNIDLEELERLLKEKASEVGLVVMTITNNSGGGQPASMENLKAAQALSHRYGVRFMVDGCRFAENAYFIKTREKGYEGKSTQEISREFFELADVISISAKKDGMSNIGGILTLRDKKLAEDCRNQLILTEGFPTYGGLSGRDLEAIAVGLWEALDENYLRYRIRSIEYIGDAFKRLEIPIVSPTGGHALYIDAKKLLPHIPVSQFPGQAFVAAIYKEIGVRCVEIGSVMFGKELENGEEQPHRQELVRLTIPRRTYTQSHMDYLVESMGEFREKISQVKGVEFTYKPKVLRHFTARFKWV